MSAFPRVPEDDPRWRPRRPQSLGRQGQPGDDDPAVPHRARGPARRRPRAARRSGMGGRRLRISTRRCLPACRWSWRRFRPAGPCSTASRSAAGFLVPGRGSVQRISRERRSSGNSDATSKLHPRFGGRLVNCLGIRRDESAARSKRVPWRRNERLSRAGREVFDWLPIFELSTDDVFRVIRRAGQKPHWIYNVTCPGAAVPSASSHRPMICAGRPNSAQSSTGAMCEIERRIGHTLSPYRHSAPGTDGHLPVRRRTTARTRWVSAAPDPGRVPARQTPRAAQRRQAFDVHGAERGGGPGDVRAPGEGGPRHLPAIPEHADDPSRDHLRRLHAQARRACRHPQGPGRGQAARDGLGTARLRQERNRAAGRRRGRPHLLRRPRAAPRSRRSEGDSLARPGQPHPLGDAGIPAAQHQHRASTSSTWRSSPPACPWCRPRCSSSSATASAASTNSPKARPSWPAATANPTAASSTACRRRWRRASFTSRSRSTRPTGAPGRLRTDRSGSAVLHRVRTRASAPVRSPVARGGFRVSQDVGVRLNIVNQRGNLDPGVERALFRGAVGEAAAVEFSAS